MKQLRCHIHSWEDERDETHCCPVPSPFIHPGSQPGNGAPQSGESSRLHLGNQDDVPKSFPVACLPGDSRFKLTINTVTPVLHLLLFLRPRMTQRQSSTDLWYHSLIPILPMRFQNNANIDSSLCGVNNIYYQNSSILNNIESDEYS